MKNFLFGALAVLFLGVFGIAAYQFGKSTKQTTQSVFSSVSPTITAQIPTSLPSPTIKVENDSNLIKTALVKKHNWNEDEITIKVSTNDGKYASGTVSAGGGGGYFYAAKVGGVWEIVADGNGVILCTSLTKYPDYPRSLIPECYDETSGKSVKR